MMNCTKLIDVVLAGVDPEIIELLLGHPLYRVLGVFGKDVPIDALGVPYLGSDSDWTDYHRRYPASRVILGVDVPTLRRKLAEHYGLGQLAGVCAEGARVSQISSVDPTVILQDGVKVLARSQIAFGCKVNHDAVIHHDVSVGRYCTLAPGCQLLGCAVIEDEVLVGAGAIVLPKRRVGSGAVVGAGAVVTRDVAPGTIVAGSPARVLSKSLTSG